VGRLGSRRIRAEGRKLRRLEGEINLNAEGGKKLQWAEGTEFYMG